MTRHEVQHLSRGGGVGDQVGRIAGAARLDRVRHLASGLLPDGAEDLAHREAGAGAEIEAAAGMFLFEQLQGRDSEIGDVDVVAERGTVRRGLVVAEHCKVDMPLQRHHPAG